MPNHYSKRTNKAIQKIKSRVHTFHGEEIAAPLVRWLNAGGGKLPGVVELIEIAERHHRTENPKLRALLLAKANAVLLDYRFAPVIDHLNDRWEIEWHDAGKGGVGAQASAILLLLDLAEAGLARSVRRCEKDDCQQFFFARFDHQKFHSDKCRTAALASDPGRREARRHYMKELRRKRKNMKRSKK